MTAKSCVSAPFISKKSNSGLIMLDVLVAMLPPAIWAIYLYGARAAVIIAVAVVFSVVPDVLIRRFLLHKDSMFDLSSVVTGVLVGFCLPVSVPLWLPAFASLAAELLTKAAAGGVGKNMFNPAATGICVSYILFGSYMTVFTKPFVYLPAFDFVLDDAILSGSRVATSLDLMREGKVVVSAVGDYFYGIAPGMLGTVSVALLLVAFVYLLLRRVVSGGAAVGYFLTLLVLTFFTAYADSEPIDFALTQLCSGGVALVMVFMLSDYTTSPKNMTGKLVFGVLCAAFTVAIRYYGMVHYGEFFALLAANMLVPMIEKVTTQRVYGTFIRREGNG